MSTMDNVQFSENKHGETLNVRLLAVGAGFASKDQICVLTNGESRIDHAREEFSDALIGTKQNRTSRDERFFLNKIWFVLNHWKKIDTLDLLDYFLADQRTLFFSGYQIYGMDHEYYRHLRKQQGDTLEQQRMFCRWESTKESPDDEKKIYTELLVKLEEKADRENWSVEKMRDKLVSYANDGRELKENYELFRKWVLDDFGAEAIREEISHLWPEWVLTREEAHALNRSYIEKNTDLRLWAIFQRLMAFETCEGTERIFELLHEWEIESSLPADKRLDFVKCVLRPYLSHLIRLPLEKEAAGHYRPTYRVIDIEFCKKYRIRQKHLQEVKTEITSPDTKKYKFFLEKISKVALDSQNRSPVRKPLTGKISEISIATTKYLKRTRSGAEHIDGEQVKRIVAQVSEQIDDMSLFPMAYLMVCVAGTSKLFSSNMSIKGETIAGVCERPYHQKPTVQKQRIARIRFLRELIRCCDLKEEGQKKSWELFFRIHGERILSIEEEQLWMELTQKESKKWARINIPEIELQLLRAEYLKDCFPVFPEYLLSYRGGSVLQRGGFAAFLDRHPDVLKECVRRIQNQKMSWKDIRKRYLDCWGALSYDLMELREVCLQASKHINLAQVLRKYAVDIQVIVDGMDAKNSVSEYVDMDELRQLLIELAIRKTLAEDAQAQLKCVMTRLMETEKMQGEC